MSQATQAEQYFPSNCSLQECNKFLYSAQDISHIANRHKCAEKQRKNFFIIKYIINHNYAKIIKKTVIQKNTLTILSMAHYDIKL